MLRRALLLLLFVIPLSLRGQVSSSKITFVTSDPAGACSAPQNMQYNISNGAFWGCDGTWTVIGGGGAGSVTMGGDVTGLSSAATVAKIRGTTVVATAPTDQQILKYVAADGQYEPTTAGAPSPTPGYPANQILSGCGVEYTSGLSFTVGACTYTISGVTYTSALTTVTLANADNTNPRIDVIIVDNTSTVSVLTGTAATPPAAPTTDPATQLPITFATVAANASTPSNVSATNIYLENTEWTCTASANFNCASTNNPYTGTKDIEATAAVLTNNVTLVKPAAGTVDLGNFNSLVFYLRSKAVWPVGNGSNASRSITVLWLNGSTQKGVGVTVNSGAFGFNSSTTSAYQQISIPTSLFAAAGQAVTTLKFLIAGNSGSTSIGFYIDQVTLQAAPQQATSVPTRYTYKGCTVIIGDPGAASAVLVNDNDSPSACANDVGSDWTITSVACWADAGSPTVTPILTGGTATSVVTGALTCGTASWAAGTVQPVSPIVHSFAANGTTCATAPCTIDANITTAGGVARYLIIKINGTI